MTIKVCHNKFNERLSKFGNGLFKIGQILILLLNPLGIYFVIIGDCNTDAPVDDYGTCMMGVMFLTVGIMGIFGKFFLMPWMELKPTIIGQINKRFKLFSWREDC